MPDGALLAVELPLAGGLLTEELPLPDVKTDWCEFYRNVTAALEGREELIVKHEESLRVMNVIDALFESARTGKSVTVNV